MYNKVFHDTLKAQLENYGLGKNELRELVLVWIMAKSRYQMVLNPPWKKLIGWIYPQVLSFSQSYMVYFMNDLGKDIKSMLSKFANNA